MSELRVPLAECRARLREVAELSGGDQVAATTDEGKLLRATLVLGTGASLGAPFAALIPAATSIELLHLASLVHDDIIDDAHERRGAPALHVAAGRDRAIVVGDLLIVASFSELGRLEGLVPASVFARSLATVAEAARRCCFGQLEELTGHGSVAETLYLDVAEQKTGSLFSAAASLGALIATVDDDATATLAAFGATLGVAYQVRDDLHDGAKAGHFAPTDATYASVVAATHDALRRVPSPCNGELQLLIDTMLEPRQP